MSARRDTEFLFEISSFRHIDRAWKQFLHPEAANNAEHTFRVCWIALTLARMEKNANHETILKLALLHDLGESRAGDLNYINKQYATRDEVQAVHDMSSGTVHEKELRKLFHEYEERETLESKIVKDADNLDVEIELREMEACGAQLPQRWNRGRDREIYARLHTGSAKKLWKEIRKTSPHAWHDTVPHFTKYTQKKKT